jgi:hypothetical protein
MLAESIRAWSVEDEVRVHLQTESLFEVVDFARHD